MAQVFGSNDQNVKVVKAAKATITFSGGGIDGTAVALNVQVQFSRQVERVPTLGNNQVLSVGLPQGTVTAQEVLFSDAPNLSDDGCSSGTVTITPDSTCGDNPNDIICKGCIVSAVSVEAVGSRGYIARGVTITFIALEM